MWPQKSEVPAPSPCPMPNQGMLPGCPWAWKLLAGLRVRWGGGCVWHEAGPLQPARSKLQARFPEGLFRRGKHRPNHSRENLQLPGTRVGGQEGLRHRGPGEPAAGAKARRAQPGAPSRVLARPQASEPRPLAVATRALLRTGRHTSSVVTGRPSLQRDSPVAFWEPWQEGSENPEGEEGVGQVGGWLGQLSALDPMVRAVGRKSAGTGRGWGAPVCGPREREGSHALHSRERS